VPLEGVGAEPRQTPQAVADALLATDRTFSAAAVKTNVVTGLTAMFAKDVTMPVPGKFANGFAEVSAALRANADNLRSKLEWQPIRVGVSSDGLHGFTFGYMTVRPPDGPVVGFKYLSYWVKQAAGWRVVAYKRRRRPEGPVSLALMPPALPVQITTMKPDAATLGMYHETLDQTERAFSTEAQRIGIGPAFAKYGSRDAVNMGGPDDAAFVVGSEAIGRSVAAGAPADSSPVSWGPDRVLVASSGDVGITFGMIRANGPGDKGQPQPPIPFFTIWRRASVTDPWRYVAE
jgi:ketosteroid isomerase-like protein